jgi:aspartyl protease
MLSFLAYLALALVGFQQAPPPPPPKPEQTAPPPVEQTVPPKPEQTAPPKPEQTVPPKPEQTAPPPVEQTAPPKPEQTAVPKPGEQTAAPKPAEQPAAAKPVSAARRLAEPEKPGPIVLPMELVSGRPVIRLMVNGKGPYAFLVSTGAQTTMIDQKLAVELALKPPVPEKDKPNGGSNGNGSGAPAAKENANGNAKENAKENKEAKDNKDKKAVPLLELDLEAGTTKLTKVPVLATDITAFVAEAGLAGRSRGVLSLSAWKDHLVTISFPPKFKVTIEPGALPEPNGEDVFPLDPETGELRLTVKVADQSIACRVEPLAPGGLQMPEEYLKRLLLDGPPIELGTTTVANQSVTIREARLAYSAMLASFELVNPVVRFVGAGDSATAGSQALVGLSISYDLANNRARIVRLPPPEKK